MALGLEWINRQWNRLFSINRIELNQSSPAQIGSAMPIYPDADISSFITDGYVGNASIYTIVSRDAKKFAHIKRGVFKVEKQEEAKAYQRHDYKDFRDIYRKKKLKTKAYGKQSVENDLATLISRPNAWQGQDQFFELLRVFYKVTGEAFIWLNRGVDDPSITDDAVMTMPVLEMYVLPSQFIEIIPDKEDVWGVLGYVFNVNGKKEYLRKIDVIHWKSCSPEFDAMTRPHLRGLSPLKAGNKVLTQDDDATDALVAMYQNGGARGVLFNETMDALTVVQKSQVEDVIRKKINTSAMKAAVASLQGKWGYLELGKSSVDMELLEGQEKAFTRLCNLLDVPSELFVPDQKYENKIQAVRDWINNSLIPAACSLRDEMNRVLLPAFGLNEKSVIIDIDPTDLPELQADMEKLAAWLKSADWFTPNEKRDYMGEEPFPDPNMDKIYMPSGLTPIEDMGLDRMALEMSANEPKGNNE